MRTLRPNYRRARELKADLDQLAIDREEAEKAGNLDQADEIRAEMDDARHQMFLTGVTSEYDL